MAKGWGCTRIDLYRWNTMLSESLYPTLHTIEVILRNALQVSIAEHFNDQEWLLDSEILQYREYEEVLRQKGQLKKAGKEASIGKIIAELNFGFWTSLLDSRYEMKLWRSKIIKQAFPHMPARDRMRHNLSRHFTQIRKLRNRIFHYEPIWYWQDLKDQRSNTLLAIQWIEPAAIELCQPDRFLDIYEQGPNAIQGQG